MRSLVLFLCLLGTLVKVNSQTRKSAYDTLNELEDRFLENANDRILQEGKDPMELPDHTTSVKRRVLFFIQSIELSLINGSLHGLSTMVRDGDFLISSDNVTNYATLTVLIGFEILDFSYTYTFKARGIGPSDVVDGQQKNLKITAIVGFNSTSQLLSLDLCRVTLSGLTYLVVHGSGLNGLLKIFFLRTATPFTNAIIKDQVEESICKTLQALIDSENEERNKV